MDNSGLIVIIFILIFIAALSTPAEADGAPPGVATMACDPAVRPAWERVDR